jgi:hypothetical protein
VVVTGIAADPPSILSLCYIAHRDYRRLKAHLSEPQEDNETDHTILDGFGNNGNTDGWRG